MKTGFLVLLLALAGAADAYFSKKTTIAGTPARKLGGHETDCDSDEMDLCDDHKAGTDCDADEMDLCDDDKGHVDCDADNMDLCDDDMDCDDMAMKLESVCGKFPDDMANLAGYDKEHMCSEDCKKLADAMLKMECPAAGRRLAAPTEETLQGRRTGGHLLGENMHTLINAVCGSGGSTDCTDAGVVPLMTACPWLETVASGMTMDSVNGLCNEPCHTAIKELSHCEGKADIGAAMSGMLKLIPMLDLCSECRLSFLEGQVACKLPFLGDVPDKEPMIEDVCTDPCQHWMRATAQACDHITLDDRRLAAFAEIKQKLSSQRRLGGHENDIGAGIDMYAEKVVPYFTQICKPCGKAMMTLVQVGECAGEEGPTEAHLANPDCKETFCEWLESCEESPEAPPLPDMPLEDYAPLYAKIKAACHGAEETDPPTTEAPTEAPTTEAPTTNTTTFQAIDSDEAVDASSAKQVFGAVGVTSAFVAALVH